ncbi:hypothetical protein CLAFUW4_10193 [Fulvia fulva]|uniref:Ubiquitin-like domain-containing protein n=1 Tax=Passalora fulva TaxID=5499 RepID=A0A9Q8LE21_PASFU|nr:uncharacterized protein CLAFUR5_04806 [Fulvia fulva]KAK4615609.1 hypothetical protein CLAFUR4_10197 [Fulvia fulva]KAK4616545.1 hypothetical protein CLAFUR0_10195 [Fulvia fulva]UJO15679.1 hypothetical protein CLAFUR5_04806 [Fulvia fulva]WPV19484.1 hypothetical protein CLAFUW4_10193 [Fulvia fulva]WPV34002.1 hypothetical protein CLAFUW7_10193 [Fulvia fulva]
MWSTKVDDALGGSELCPWPSRVVFARRICKRVSELCVVCRPISHANAACDSVLASTHFLYDLHDISTPSTCRLTRPRNIMPVKASVQVPLDDKIAECTISVPATVGRLQRADFINRVTSAVLKIANDMNDEAEAAEIDRFNRQHLVDGQEPDVEQLQNRLRLDDSTTIVLKGVHGMTAQYRVKRTTSMGKIMDMYATQAGFHAGTLRFMYIGQRTSAKDTLESLEVEDGDIIEVASEQIGT